MPKKRKEIASTKKGHFIKPGAEHNTRPGFKFDSAHKNQKSADFAEEVLLEKPEVKEVLITEIEPHFILWKKTRRPKAFSQEATP